MKKAVIIFAHQLPEQLNIFVNQLLADPENDVYIHVNKKYESLKQEIIKNDRVFVTNQNIEITWGDDSLLKAIIIMFRQVIGYQNEYKYILLCSGQDLLVRDGLDEFLTKNYGRAYIDGYEDNKKERAFLLYNWPARYRRLIDFKFHPVKIMRRLRLELFKLGVSINRKKVNYDVSSVVFYKSTFWCAIPDYIVEYVIDFVDRNPTFLEIYDKALVAEEGFISTVIMASDYRDSIDYVDGRSHSLTYIKSFNNGHPLLITMQDIEDIEKSGMFFARKFDIRKDKDVIDYFVKHIGVHQSREK